MQLHLTADQEAQLSRIAIRVGTSPEHIVMDAALRVMEEANTRQTALRAGIAQADRGELLDDAVVLQWLQTQEQRR